jgi:hypothetical protein
MKKLAFVSLLMVLVTAVTTASGQGAPASAGQTVSPQGEASADAAVKAKHDKRAQKKATKASKKASAASM